MNFIFLSRLYFQDVVVSQPTATDQAPESGGDEKVGAAAAGGSGERSPLKESTPPPSYSTLVMEDEKWLCSKSNISENREHGSQWLEVIFRGLFI